MHFKEIFDLTLPQGQGHMKHCPLYHVTYGQWFRRCIYKKIHYLTFDIDPKVKGVRVTLNVAQYPVHHVTYASTKFDVATSNCQEDAFTRKYII